MDPLAPLQDTLLEVVAGNHESYAQLCESGQIVGLRNRLYC